MFRLTARQEEANLLLGGLCTHLMLFGGSRSGKTFAIIRAMVIRALRASRSRHAILRYRFNTCKTKVALDTFPAVMEKCFPDIPYKMNKEDWYAILPNGSEVWFGGLDDKLRTEKILGSEFASIFLNECSEIPWSARNLAVTRLAQSAKLDGMDGFLPLRMYYDCNPPDKSHWTYRLFVQKVDPDTKRALNDSSLYGSMKMNPVDNLDNLPQEYIGILKGLSARLQRRFLEGEFRDSGANALFNDEHLDKWRVLDGTLPDFQRVVVAVDPSGSGDTDNADNDAIGICVAALGVDGNGYLLEDLTVKAGPATWGRIATDAYDRHAADRIVAEANYGGAMVEHVIQTARPRTPFSLVHATRGKVVRAEPVSSLAEAGKVRLVGYFPELEEELSGFTTNGYTGDGSPNRADAFVWAFAELFPGIVSGGKRKQEQEVAPTVYLSEYGDAPDTAGAWMGS